ncbi:hypothetical protein AB1Y20_022613 [Prymnesium parvum]|uniref:Uncharacterized protein n=1 Tax=Prymnesium parvum TaxID=97485 RepID=A0AB34JHN5_PRYPA
MLALTAAAASLAYVGPMAAPVVPRRVPSVEMAAQKKVITMENLDSGLFEAREVDLRTPPIYLLSRLEELKAATALSEAGLLTLAQENQVFSKLESAGAFSKLEKLLPTVEKFGLLSFFEKCLDVPNGVLFTIANTMLFYPIGLLTLQGFAFLPGAEGIFVPIEILTDLAVVAAGTALFVLAYIIGVLQED